MLFTNILPLISVAAAVAVPRDFKVPPGMCCFNLAEASSGSPLQQDMYSGLVYLHSEQGQGQYCLDPNDKRNILWDRDFNACIVNYYNKVQCLDPTPGDDVWGLQRNGDKKLLTHNGSPDFKACNTATKAEFLSGAEAPKDSQCRDRVQLFATNFQGSCGQL